MSKKTVAELIVDTLIAARVKRVYGITGDSLIAITDGIRKRKEEIEWITVRHEEVAAFAAGAEAQISHSLVVCAGTCGPGNLHLINGLYDCHRSRIPVLAIAAHINTIEIGSNYFQETHPERLFLECSHYCEFLSQPEQMPRIFELAIQNAMNLQGVSVVIVPGDIALKSMGSTEPKIPALCSFSTTRPSDQNIKMAAKILNEGNRITILAGIGCADAHNELMQIAEKLKAPIVHTMRGKEYIEFDNPYNVGMTGVLGLTAGYQAVMDCDVLLMLGTDFPYRQFYPEKAKVIQVDIRGENIGARTKVDLGLVGDVKETILALIAFLNEKKEHKHLDQALTNFQKASDKNLKEAIGQPFKKPIPPQYLAQMINEVANDDAIFTCDVGTPTVWAARFLKMNGKRKLLGSFCHGSMASAFPQAIGAQFALPKRQVIALCGDGGFSMLMGDILTIQQYQLPIKIVIFNNSAFGFVELEMHAAGFLNYGTHLKNPNFAQLAESIDIKGIRIEEPADLEAGIKEGLNHPGPVLIDVVVNRQEIPIPSHVEINQALGFSLFAIKAVLNGQGNAVINLSSSNIFRKLSKYFHSKN